MNKLNICVTKNIRKSTLEFIKKEFNCRVYIYEDLIRGVDTVSSPLDILLLDYEADNTNINPDRYSEAIGKHTKLDTTLDMLEYDVNRLDGLLRIGFGRAAQSLAVDSGSRIVQYIRGHQEKHKVYFDTLDQIITVNSNHNQLIYPYELKESQYEILVYSNYFKSNTYLNGHNEEIKLSNDFVEIEGIYFKNTNSLCFQFDLDEDNKEYVKQLIENKINSKQ